MIKDAKIMSIHAGNKEIASFDYHLIPNTWYCVEAYVKMMSGNVVYQYVYISRIEKIWEKILRIMFPIHTWLWRKLKNIKNLNLGIETIWEAK